MLCLPPHGPPSLSTSLWALRHVDFLMRRPAFRHNDDRKDEILKTPPDISPTPGGEGHFTLGCPAQLQARGVLHVNKTHNNR